MKNAKLKQQLFAAYGGARCASCGFDDIRALVLDHINGGGAAERRRYGNNVNLWRALLKADAPPGYQVLCANCNVIKMWEKREWRYARARESA